MRKQNKKDLKSQVDMSDLQWRKLLTGMNWLKEQGSRLRLISTLSPANSRTATRFSSSNTCHCRDEQSNRRWSSAESRGEGLKSDMRNYTRGIGSKSEEKRIDEKKWSKAKLTEYEWRIGFHGEVRQVKPLNNIRGQRLNCSSPGIIWWENGIN